MSQNNGQYKDLEAALEASKDEIERIANTLSQEAFTKAGFSADISDQYVAFLERQYEFFSEAPDLAEQVSKRIVETVAAYKDFQKTWSESVSALLDADPYDIKYSEALVKTGDALQTLYGVNLDGYDNVVRKFVAKNTDELSKIAGGDFSNFEEIGRQLADEMSKAVAGGKYTEQFTGLFTVLDSLGLQDGQGSGDLSGYKIDKFNEALANSDLAPEQVREILEAAGYTDIKFVDGKLVSVRKVDLETKLDPVVSSSDKVAERYHEINEILSDIEESQNRVSAAKDRAYGPEKIQYIEQEIDLLDQQKKAQEELLNQITAYYQIDRAKAVALGAKFDGNGRITNYEELTANNEATKKAFDEYEKTLNMYQSEYSEFLELQYEETDKCLELIQEKVEQTVKASERELKYLEFAFNRIGDSAADFGEKLNNLIQQGNQKIIQLNASKKALADLLNENGVTTEATADNVMSLDWDMTKTANLDGKEKEALEQYFNEIIDGTEALNEQADTIRETVIDAYNAWNQEIEDQISLLEHQQSLLDSYENIADLLGDRAGISAQVMRDLASAQTQISQATMEASKSAYETAKANFEEAERAGVLTKEQLAEMEQDVNSKQIAFMQSWAEALEAAGVQFEKEVELILKTFDDAVGGIEDKLDWFEKQKDLNDFYLKDYEKTYEINKLNRKLLGDLDKTTSIKGNKLLVDLQKELLSYQEAGKEMSDYDLQYMQKKYELALAQIALEDAQNAKSQVRLTRDSQGNYGYIYTADQNNIDKAQQNYEDKLYDLQKFMNDSTDSLSSLALGIMQEFKDAVAELDPTDPEYEAKLAQLTAFYSEKLSQVSGEFNDLITNSKKLNEEYGLNLADTFHETLIGSMYPDVESFGELTDKALKGMQTVVSELSTSYSTYASNIDETLKKAGTTLSGFAGEIDKAVNDPEKGAVTQIEKIKTKINELVELACGNEEKGTTGAFAKLVEAANTAMGGLNLDPLNQQIEGFKTKVDGAIAYYQKLLNVSGLAPDAGTQGAVSTALKYLADETVNYNKGKVTAAQLSDMDWAAIAQNKGSEALIKKINSGDFDSEDAVALVDMMTSTTQKAIKGEEDSVPDTDTDPPKTTNSYTGNYVIKGEDNFSLNNNGTLTLYEGGEEVGTFRYSTDANNDKIYYLEDRFISEAERLSSAGYKVVSKSGIKQMKYLDNQIKYIEKDGKRYQIRDIKNHSQDGLAYAKYDDKDPLEQFVAPPNPTPWSEYQQIGYLPEPRIYKDGYVYTTGGNDAYKVDEISLVGSVLYGKPGGYPRIRTFDTGGYTGVWGPEGRLAMLHQKELVLNAHDTENLLSAVSMIRSIVEKVELNAAQQRYNNILNSFKASVAQTPGTLDQNVHIEAHFPNATDHSQIEEAFGNIVNLAAQYANRK